VEDDQSQRLSPQTIAVLAVMLGDVDQPWYGFELCQAAGLQSGTVYPMLARLERRQWLVSEWEAAEPGMLKRPRRRLYRLTGEGEVVSRAAVERLEADLRRAQRTVRPEGRTRVRPA
jgi:PadR family transcriptional regulator, regulatory protein PadR